MTFREFSGKTVEEAIRGAMREFESDLADLDIEILSAGSRGILGVGGEEARILAAPKSAVAQAESVRELAPASSDDGAAADEDEDEEDPAGDQAEALARAAMRETGGRDGGRPRSGGPGGPPSRGGYATFDPADTRPPRRSPRPERRPRPPREPQPDEAEREQRPPLPFIPAKPVEELTERERATLEEAQRVLEEVLRLMGLTATVTIGAGAETAKLNVSGDDLGLLIGRRGEKLASLQHLVNLIVAKREGAWHRISVDVENYRGRREEQLREVATRAAKRVEETGKIIQLDPMPALERRIVHVALVENPRVRTQSVGVEPNRRIVILPAERQPA
ncbi:MAG: RNA-binding cell elongation regulator Jag/EloR [Candidatus Limnocylindria bacterium]